MLLPPPSFLGTSKSNRIESIVSSFHSVRRAALIKKSNIGLIFIIYWISAWIRHNIIYWWHFGTETLQPTSNHYFTLANILISSAQTHTRHFPIYFWKRQLRKWYVCSSHSGWVTSLVQKKSMHSVRLQKKSTHTHSHRRSLQVRKSCLTLAPNERTTVWANNNPQQPILHGGRQPACHIHITQCATSESHQFFRQRAENESNMHHRDPARLADVCCFKGDVHSI